MKSLLTQIGSSICPIALMLAGCTGPSETGFADAGPASSKTLTSVRPNQSTNSNSDSQDQDKKDGNMETATFGAGCFWCVEAVFQQLEGVSSVKSGYMGGSLPNPTYKQICTGSTGHAEVCQLKYDPEVISFDELLEVFWKTHDPTTLNRQGNDVGTQYRSAVFYHNDDQKQIAESYKKKLNEEKAFRNPVVTEVTAATIFYEAEDYHQDYWAKNPNQGYCRLFIPPKLE